MMQDNPIFDDFRKRLEAQGVTIRWGWSARTYDGPRRNDDVAQILFYGDGFQPAILHAVVIDYGRNRDGQPLGFALLTEKSNHIDQDVRAIVGEHYTEVVPIK